MDTEQQFIVLKGLEGNAPTHLSAVQQFLVPYMDVLTLFWIAVWGMTAIFLLVQLFREYEAHRRKRD